MNIQLILALGSTLLLGGGPAPGGAAASVSPSDSFRMQTPLAETGEPAEFGQLVVQPDPGGSVVGLTIHIPVGGARDPEGREGTAFLLGQLLEEELSRRVAGLHAEASVEVEHESMTLSFASPPHQWQAVLNEAESVLRGEGLDPSRLDSIRERQRARLTFEEGAPVRTFQIEKASLLRREAQGGGRPLMGSRETLDRITFDDLQEFRSRNLSRPWGVLAVVGPVDAAEVGRALSMTPVEVSASSPFQEQPYQARAAGRRGTADTAAAPEEEPIGPLRTRLFRDSGAVPSSAPSFTGSPAWTQEERQLQDMALTSSWIAVAWPYPRETPRILLEFLAHTFHEALVPSPPDPGLYSAEIEVVVVEGRPVLVVSAVADPRSALRWEERIREGLEALAQSPPEGSFFELTRRRYRSALLMELADPLARSRHLAREINDSGEATDVQTQIWSLSREGLARTAEAASGPRIFILGPVEMMERAHR
jgi:hypothetical protein